jgi:hypothetical protein
MRPDFLEEVNYIYSSEKINFSTFYLKNKDLREELINLVNSGKSFSGNTPLRDLKLESEFQKLLYEEIKNNENLTSGEYGFYNFRYLCYINDRIICDDSSIYFKKTEIIGSSLEKIVRDLKTIKNGKKQKLEDYKFFFGIPRGFRKLHLGGCFEYDEIKDDFGDDCFISVEIKKDLNHDEIDELSTIYRQKIISPNILERNLFPDYEYLYV